MTVRSLFIKADAVTVDANGLLTANGKGNMDGPGVGYGEFEWSY